MGVLTIYLLDVHAGDAITKLAGSIDGSSTNVWVLAALTLLGSSVIAGVITSVLGNLRAAAVDRRNGYAKAVRCLIARGEYPYRVRRRVSDDPDVLGSLVERGHDLQEQLAACRTWVASEHRVLGAMFEEALSEIDRTVAPATGDAWGQAPITTAAGMNLDGWGPGDQWAHVAKLERAIAFRFGWRRALPASIWQRRL